MSEFIEIDARHREHFEYFRGVARPLFRVCADVDVTAIWNRARGPGQPSFFLAALHAAVLAIDDVEPLRLRLRGGRVYRHDHVGMSTTILREDGSFGYARIPYATAFDDFAAAAQPVIERARTGHGLASADEDDNLIYHSTLPWLRFTAFSNAVREYDSIPRLVFGKCVAGGGGMVMPVALEVHHALVHGRDAARFYERFQERLSGRGGDRVAAGLA